MNHLLAKINIICYLVDKSY